MRANLFLQCIKVHRTSRFTFHSTRAPTTLSSIPSSSVISAPGSIKKIQSDNKSSEGSLTLVNNQISNNAN